MSKGYRRSVGESLADIYWREKQQLAKQLSRAFEEIEELKKERELLKHQVKTLVERLLPDE